MFSILRYRGNANLTLYLNSIRKKHHKTKQVTKNAGDDLGKGVCSLLLEEVPIGATTVEICGAFNFYVCVYSG